MLSLPLSSAAEFNAVAVAFPGSMWQPFLWGGVDTPTTERVRHGSKVIQNTERLPGFQPIAPDH